MKKEKNKKGFTLAELLVVVAIIGILVAVSIPIFTAQREKAIRAVNQANIRAAKAAALTELYSGNTDYLETSSNGLYHYIYFVYDVKQETIKAIIPQKGATSEDTVDWDTVNAPAAEQLKKAANNKICDKIYVFENINKDANKDHTTGESHNAIQTAPYYDENGKVGTMQGKNPFGPRT